jgi:hypothetical protein
VPGAQSGPLVHSESWNFRTMVSTELSSLESGFASKSLSGFSLGDPGGDLPSPISTIFFNNDYVSNNVI